MNFKDKRTRRICAASASAAVIVAGGVTVGATLATAAGSLTISPGATSAMTLDLGAAISGGSLSAALANATYAVNVSTAVSGARELTFESFTPPSGVTYAGTPHLFFRKQATGVATGPTTTWGAGLTAGNASSGSGITAGDDVFLTADIPGTYKLHFSDTMGTVGTDDDATSPTITLSVKDVEGVSVATGTATDDDWKPTISATSSVVQGVPTTATLDLTSLSTVDSRGSTGGKGVLGDAVAASVGFSFTGTGLASANSALSTAGTTKTATSVSKTYTPTLSGASGSVAIGAAFDSNASGTFTAADADLTGGASITTAVTSNGVSAYATDLAVTPVTGSVAAGTNAATLVAGTGSATYSVKVTDSDADKSGNVVYFTLTPVANTPGLTGTGTLLSNTSGTKVYTVPTDSAGVASITVTSDKTTAGTTYTVDATTNTVNATQLLATYAARAASSIAVTNTSSSLNVTTGNPVTLTGKLMDQFGSAYVPVVTDTQQVQLFTGTAASGCVNPALGGVAGATATTTLSGGAFSFTYTPASAPTAGYCTKFAFGYDVNKDGSIAGTNPESVFGQVNWATATPAAGITVTTPNNNAVGLALSDSQNIHVAQGVGATDFGDANGQITGTVVDGSNVPLAYKTVTISGSDGVYFSLSNAPDATNPLVTTITKATNGSGQLTGVYAYFTKAGAGKITLKADSVTKEIAFTTADSVEPYKVTVNSVAGSPGDVVIITGTVYDAFGNPATNRTVDLSTGTSTLGVLGSASPKTNAAGVFSTTYTTGTNQSGTATLTATLRVPADNAAQAANRTAAGAWSTAGVTVADGAYKASSTITIAKDAVALNKIATRLGAGNVTVAGTARAGNTVTLYKAGKAFATVTANATTGVFSKTVSISRNTVFQARTSGANSNAVVAHVRSTVKIKAKAGRNHRVSVTVSGGPSKSGRVVLWQRLKTGKYGKVGTAKVTRGVVTWTLNAGKGAHIYRATFTSAGCDASATVSVSIRS